MLEDGRPAQMFMYLWSQSIYNASVQVSGPSNIRFQAIESVFSPNNKLRDRGAASGRLVLVQDQDATTHLACGSLQTGNMSSIMGSIALIDRGVCLFVEKVGLMQGLGARGVVIVNNQAGDAIQMGGSDIDLQIPAVMVTLNDGNQLKELLARGATVSVALDANPGSLLDSSLDNLIVTHEYGHGISIRLAGGAGVSTCIDNQEQMGEGWSDYFGLMLTTDWLNARPEDRRGIGTYVSNQPVTGTGIRDYPYSTSKSINPLQYDDIRTASIPHGVGAVWCSMLWDMTWNLIQLEGASNDLYRGRKGNNIALRLVLEGLKLQKCSPGFVDGRDAILKADSILYGARYQFPIWKAFAGRGLGVNAAQNSPQSVLDGFSSFDLPDFLQTVVLPFEATDLDDFIAINFTSQRQFDNDRFELERSVDGVHYQLITSFPGSPLQIEPEAFQYEDRQVVARVLYRYRLMAIDRFGLKKEVGKDSAIIIPVEEMVLYPNPASGQVTVRISRSIGGAVHANLYTLDGLLLSSQQVEAEALHSGFVLDYGSLPAGTYLAELRGAWGRYVRPLVLY